MGLTKKQKAVYDYIVTYNEDNGITPTQKEIKEHFNLKSFGSVQKYIKYLVDDGCIAVDWNARQGIRITEDENIANSEVEVPLLGLVAAGNPIEAMENPTEHIGVPKHMVSNGGKSFALTIQGESMIDAGIMDGDTILCRVSNTCRQGQIAVAIHNGDATVKYYYNRGDHIELVPANSTMSPIIINDGDFKIAGTVTGLLRFYE